MVCGNKIRFRYKQGSDAKSLMMYFPIQIAISFTRREETVGLINPYILVDVPTSTCRLILRVQVVEGSLEVWESRPYNSKNPPLRGSSHECGNIRVIPHDVSA